MRSTLSKALTGSGHYEQLLIRCKSLEPIRTAVAYPCEATALAGAVDAADRGLITPLLVGPVTEIAAACASAGRDISGLEIIDVPNSIAAADKAVTSRADSVRSRIASCAVAMLVAHARRGKLSERV